MPSHQKARRICKMTVEEMISSVVSLQNRCGNCVIFSFAVIDAIVFCLFQCMEEKTCCNQIFVFIESESFSSNASVFWFKRPL